MISLAFGRYILEPFFIQCEIPELAIKLITAVGISEYYRCKSKKKKNPHKSDWRPSFLRLFPGGTASHIVFFVLTVP